nr:F-box domain, leucine-rich repeat domain, L domain-like protein [Tanacetum cinerariifolium]
RVHSRAVPAETQPKMSADVAQSHGDDDGGEDRPLHAVYPAVAWVALLTKVRISGLLQRQTKAQFERQDSGQAEYPRQDPDLSLKEITDTKGPVPIQFELRDKQTVMPLGDHAAHWSSYIGEVIRSVPLYYPSWLKVPKERKATPITDIGTQFDLRPHMESPDRTEINAGIQQHLQKAYNINKAAFKAQHWVIDPTTGTYNVEKIRRTRPENITASEWDKGRPQPLRSTRRSLTPTSWHTLLTENSFGMRNDEEMRRLEATGTYSDDEINRLARGGKQRGHIPGMGRVLPARATASPSTPAHESTLNSLHKKVDFIMSLFKSGSKYSYMFSQFESGGASGSGGCGDDEEGADHQDEEGEDGDGDTASKGNIQNAAKENKRNTLLTCPKGTPALRFSMKLHHQIHMKVLQHGRRRFIIIRDIHTKKISPLRLLGVLQLTWNESLLTEKHLRLIDSELLIHHNNEELEEDKLRDEVNEITNLNDRLDDIGGDELGEEVAVFDEEMVKIGSKKWDLTLCGQFVGHNMSVPMLNYHLRRMWARFGFKEIIDNGNGKWLMKLLRVVVQKKM